MTGDKLTAALKAVTEMDDLALTCVHHKLKMIDLIGTGVDSFSLRYTQKENPSADGERQTER